MVLTRSEIEVSLRKLLEVMVGDEDCDDCGGTLQVSEKSYDGDVVTFQCTDCTPHVPEMLYVDRDILVNVLAELSMSTKVGLAKQLADTREILSEIHIIADMGSNWMTDMTRTRIRTLAKKGLKT